MNIRNLEEKIDELIQLCDALDRKRTVMQADRDTWKTERNRLLEKNELAKTKIEAMIMRLKSLEQE